MSSENNQKFCSYLLNAAKSKNMKNIVFVVIPDSYRPVDYLPEILINTIKNAKGYISNIKVEEDFTFNQPIQDLCRKNKV